MPAIEIAGRRRSVDMNYQLIKIIPEVAIKINFNCLSVFAAHQTS